MAEFEAGAEKLADLARGQAGFVLAALITSTAYPFKYAYYSAWQRREDFRAFLRSDAYAALQKDVTPGLVTSARPTEVYEEVHTTRAEPLPTPGFTAILDWAVRTDPATVAAFTARRQEAAQIMQQYGHGFVSYGLYRSLADPARYWSGFNFESEATMRASIGRPEYQQWLQAHPLTEHTTAPVQTELFDLVFSARPR